jgi:hypothetical protein
MDPLIERAIRAKRESKYVDFKEAFDPSLSHDWCEIVKDVVAMANSGGGAIVFGVDDGGKPSAFDIQPILALDPALITDKLVRYTGVQFSEFEILEATRYSSVVALQRVLPVDIPLIFTSPGTYEYAPGKQKTAFARGTIYFRHGAKSEPATREDIRAVIERNLEAVRKSWINGVRKVVEAPRGHQVHVLAPEVVPSTSPHATPIRLVDDPAAPAYYRLTPDVSHPYRQKELIAEVNRRLPREVQLKQFDMHVVRKAHEIDSNETFCHHPKFSSPQYSQAFINWLVDRFMQNKRFFEEAREQFARMRRTAS